MKSRILVHVCAAEQTILNECIVSLEEDGLY
jgi:hypothetical protein